MKAGLPKVLARLLPILFFCGGCSTYLTHGGMFGTTGVYRGVRQDADCVYALKYALGANPPTPDFPITRKEEIPTICCGIIDFPFSLTADTLVLPYDLTTIHNKNSNEDSDK